jgi:NAD-dependent deacetylase
VTKEIRELIEEATKLVLDAQKIVVFTGTGVSTVSAIYSSTTGPSNVSTNTYKGSAFPDFVGDPATRRRSWQTWNMFRMIEMAQPNPAHYAIAELDKMGKLDCVITQNVDGLHQKAGVPDKKVIELHGSLRWLKCTKCDKRYPIIEVAKMLAKREEKSICSDCSGMLKSSTVSYGEPPLTKETSEAEQHSRTCDMFMVVGSSLMVHPAAYMPVYAIEAGAKLVIINLGTTFIDDMASVLINRAAEKVLPKIIEVVKSKLSQSH